MKAFTAPQKKHTNLTLPVLIVAGIATLSLALGVQPPNASAEECVRAPHEVTLKSTPNQYGTPGQTASYHLEILNNDEGCGTSNFTFSNESLPAGWSFAPTDGIEIVDSKELTGYSVWYQSPVAGVYNGTYDFTVNVARAEEPTVASVNISYTVYGGLTVVTPPTPIIDTTLPTVTNVSPGSGSYLKKRSTVQFTAAVSDNVAIQKVEFFLDGSLICSGVVASCTWTVPNARGDMLLEVRATDASGNTASKFATYKR